MADNISGATGAVPARTYRGEAAWRRLMSDFEVWNGSQASFCEARGVSLKSFQNWRRRLGLITRRSVAAPAGFVELAAASGPGWDVELSLGDGVVLRVRRS